MIRERETVGLLKEKQMIFPEWMQKAVEGLKDSDFVTVVRHHTPFGSFVVGIEEVTQPGGPPPSMEPDQPSNTFHCNIDQEVSGMPDLRNNPLGWA